MSQNNNLNNEIVIKEINNFLNDMPKIEKNNIFYPDECGLYQAHTIANNLADKLNLTRNDILIVMRKNPELKTIKVRNKQLSETVEEDRFIEYYFSSNISKKEVKKLKERYEQ